MMPGKTGWYRIGGSLKTVAISNSLVYGVNKGGADYMKRPGKNAKWKHMGTSHMTDVCVNNRGNICGVNGKRNILCRTTKTPWKQVPGKATNVAANNHVLVAVGVRQTLFLRRHPGRSSRGRWIRQPGKGLRQVNINAYGTICGVTDARQGRSMWCRTGHRGGRWKRVPGMAFYMSLSNHQLFHLGSRSGRAIYFSSVWRGFHYNLAGRRLLYQHSLIRRCANRGQGTRVAVDTEMEGSAVFGAG
jgi:hypothetical protein